MSQSTCPFCDGPAIAAADSPNVDLCDNPRCDAFGEMVRYRRITVDVVYAEPDDEQAFPSLDAALEHASPHLARLLGPVAADTDDLTNEAA